MNKHYIIYLFKKYLDFEDSDRNGILKSFIDCYKINSILILKKLIFIEKQGLEWKNECYRYKFFRKIVKSFSAGRNSKKDNFIIKRLFR